MASNLAGGLCIGELNAAVIRAARLDADCSPTGGANSGLVTAGLVTLTADPDIEEGTVFEPKNGDGDIMFTYEEDDKIKRYNHSGEFGFADFEMMELLFGGSTILGKPGGDFAGKVIGYADRPYTAAPRNGVYFEVIAGVEREDYAEGPMQGPTVSMQLRDAGMALAPLGDRYGRFVPLHLAGTSFHLHRVRPASGKAGR